MIKNRNTQPTESISVTPHAIECENSVIGAMLLEPDKTEEALEILQDENCFLSEENRAVFRTIKYLISVGSPVDLPLVTQHLARTGMLENAGGHYRLTKLVMSVVSSAHVEQHALVVKQEYVGWEIIRICREAISRILEGEDRLEVLHDTQKQLSEILDGQNEATHPISQIVKEVIDNLYKQKDNPGILTGIPTGIKKLDRITNGWQPTDIIILAARPGQGKTAKALHFAYSAAIAKKPVLFFSMEMSKNALTQRLVASVSRVPLTRIKRAELADNEWTAVNDAANKIASLPIYFDDRGGLSNAQVRAKARKLKKSKGISLIVIDYLQLMTVRDAKGKSREAQISEISRELKALAKDLELPIICLCQMNREIEKVKRKPLSSDLRESGSLEQDASVVAFIHHEVVNGATETKLIITKNREGETDDIDIDFFPQIQRWADRDDMSFQGYDRYDLKPVGFTSIDDEPF